MMNKPEEKKKKTFIQNQGGSPELNAGVKNTVKEILTGQQLERASDGEPVSLWKSEELSQKHKSCNDGEDARQH